MITGNTTKECWQMTQKKGEAESNCQIQKFLKVIFTMTVSKGSGNF